MRQPSGEEAGMDRGADLSQRLDDLEEKVEALLTQDHAVSRWGGRVEARLEALERRHPRSDRPSSDPSVTRSEDLAPYTSESLLDELVDRGRIHPSRLLEDHYVLLQASTYHMVHPLSCDLGDCPFDQEAESWEGELVAVGGWYRWPSPDTSELDAVVRGELPFDTAETGV